MQPGWLAALIVLGTIATLAWPGLVRRARVSVQRVGVAPATGWGLLALVLVPIVALFFAITIIGLPIAVLILLLYSLAIVAAAVASACVLGDWLLSAIWAEYRPGPVWLIGAVLIGSVALWLVCSIRVIGPIFWLVAVAAGFGILGSALWRGDAVDDDVIDIRPDSTS